MHRNQTISPLPYSENYSGGGYEVYRKYISNSLDKERETVHVMDGRDRFVIIDTLTVENGVTLGSPVETIRYQYSNHLGSACLELDGSAAIISYEEYHPFGTTSYRAGSSEAEVSLKRYKYVGKERDEETGLYYYGARYYAGWLCRFVSCDPLQHKYPYYTPYQYAGNKPVTYIDLDGLEPSKRLIRRATEYGEWYVKAIKQNKLYSNPTYKIKGNSLFLYVEDQTVPGFNTSISTEISITRGNFGIFGEFAPKVTIFKDNEARKWPHDVWEVENWTEYENRLEALELLGIPVRENFTDKDGTFHAYSYAFAVVLFVVDIGDMVPNSPRRGKKKGRKNIKSPDAVGSWLKKVSNVSEIPYGCEKVADRAVLELGDGAQYLQITPNYGNQLGPVNGQESGWSWHVAAIKDGIVYDKLTGSEGMNLESYKKLFDFNDDITFEISKKRTLK